MRNVSKNQPVATLGLCLALCLPAAFVRALDANSDNANAIMRVALDPPNLIQSVTRMKMTIKDSVSTRERVLTARAKRFSDARKSLILIEQPADVRSTGFLSVDYDAHGKSDEQWLYLPKLHRVSRVPSSGKSDAFVGSDFSLADLSRRDSNDYDLKLLQASVNVGDEDCWLIEGTPRTPQIAEEIGYSKVQTWVSKQKQIPLQFKAWIVNSDKTKYFKASDIRNDDGVWTPHRLQMRTLAGSAVSSETVIDVISVSHAASDIADADFTQERLEHGV